MTLLIFDIDGTLINTNKVDSMTFAQTYEAIYGKSFPTIDWTSYPHVTDTIIFKTVIDKHFGRVAESQEVIDFQEMYVQSLVAKRRAEPHHFLEIPAAVATLNFLAAADEFIIGVATGGWERAAKVKLNHAGINTRLLYLKGADGLNTREEIINHVIGQVRAAAHPFRRVVYIGDAPWDVHTTRNLNMDFIGVRVRGDLDTLSDLGATTVIRDFADRAGFLKAIENANPPRPIQV